MKDESEKLTNTKKQEKGLGGILIRNIVSCLLFLLLIAVILITKTKVPFSDILPSRQVIGDSFSTVIFVVIAFIFYFIFLCVASSVIAFNSRGYFSDSEIKSAILYIFSIIPPIIVSKYLINSYGSLSLSLITSYVIISFFVNSILKKYIFTRFFPFIKGKGMFLVLNIIIEMAIFVTLWSVVVKIPAVKNILPRYNLDDLMSFWGWCARVIFIMVFNYINYISIEYISMTFMLEMKKPHVKYYFLYNNNIFKRFMYIVRTNLPVILKKIKLYLAWFVSIIILFEMDNHIYQSVGNRIYYQGDGETLNGRNVMAIFVIIYGLLLIINTVIEICIVRYGAGDRTERPELVEKSHSILPGWKVDIRKFRHKKLYLVCAGFLLIITMMAVCYSRQYTILGHYDFYTGQKYTVGYVIHEELRNLTFDRETVNEYMEQPLCVREKGVFFTRYRIAEFIIKGTSDYNRFVERVVPVLEVSSDNMEAAYPDLSFIINGNRKNFTDDNYLVEDAELQGISYNYSVVIPAILADVYIPLNLERNYKSNGSDQPPVSSNKLLFPMLVYYLFYFFLAAFLLLFIIYAVYKVIVTLNTAKIHKLFLLIGKEIFSFIKLFVTSTPFIVIIAFLYVFFPQGNVESGFSTLASILQITNNVFIDSILVYCLFSMVIILYSLPSAIDDISNFTVNIFQSEEVKYMTIIGFDKSLIKKTILAKYGWNKIFQIFFECFLFLFVLQFFVMYCFSLSQFTDIIGIGSVLSIENVVTKLYRTQVGFTPIVIVHYLVLFIIYGVIFAVPKILKKGRSN